MKITDCIKIDLPGSVKVGIGSILYCDDISLKARTVLEDNKVNLNVNKAGLYVIDLPNNTVIVPAICIKDQVNCGSISIVILPDNSMLEVVNLTNNQVLLSVMQIRDI